MVVKFLIDEIGITSDLYQTLTKNIPETWESEIRSMIKRHVNGDWGDVDQETVDENNTHFTLEDDPVFGGPTQLGFTGTICVVSAYHASDRTRVMIVTGWAGQARARFPV